MKILSFFICLLLSTYLYGQHSFRCTVKDSTTHETLIGVNVVHEASKRGVITDLNGNAELTGIPSGNQKITFSYIGYKKQEITFYFPIPVDRQPIVVFLVPDRMELGEVVISSTRTNSRIEDLPVKVEVLGQDDMEEESTIVPGNISSILGDLSIITVQRTDVVTGNDEIRMQGLDARYTQLLKDGLPLYGGFSGSLGVLSIPPLDLKQVEIIKGSCSTLYGGGAIGGLINFISKTPVDTPKTTLTLSSSLPTGYNLNFYASNKAKKNGFTLFTGLNTRQATDVDHDGYTEIPYVASFTMHPRLFFYINPKTDLNVGFNGTFETRTGGSLLGINHGLDLVNYYTRSENTQRLLFDLFYSYSFRPGCKITFKTANSNFFRFSQYSDKRSNIIDLIQFTGRQKNNFSELNVLFGFKKHQLVIGANNVIESFRRDHADYGNNLFKNYDYNTNGVFIQDNWQFLPKFNIEAGFRFDHHDEFGSFYLPRIAVFYKPAGNLSIRLSAGTGYSIPTLFDFFDTESQFYTIISGKISPEKSYGINADINYNTVLFNELALSINQAFYFSEISRVNTFIPVFIMPFTYDVTTYRQTNQPSISSIGTDTYLRLIYRQFELYLGYNHTLAEHKVGKEINILSYNPMDKFSTTFTWELVNKWRTGIEASFTANQYLPVYGIYKNDGVWPVPDYWFLAGMVERKLKWGSIVLNCENLLDLKQTAYKSHNPPGYDFVYMNIEGRVTTLTLKADL